MISGLLRTGVSLTLLALLAWWLDAGALLDRLSGFDPRWALVAIAISFAQFALLAFRWRFTAGRLGLDLPFGTALREYYLATFLNQVLPGGIMGDVSRAWRHGRAAPERRIGPAARAVILERASGQVVMGGVAALSFVILPLTFGAVPATLTLAVCGVGGAGLAALLAFGRRPRAGLLATFRREVHTALLARDALPVQLLSSTLVVGTYLATYVVAARAVGVSTPLWMDAPAPGRSRVAQHARPGNGRGVGGARGHGGGPLGRGRTHHGGRRGDLGRVRDPGAALEPSGSRRPAQRRSRSKRRSFPRGT